MKLPSKYQTETETENNSPKICTESKKKKIHVAKDILKTKQKRG